MIEESLLKDVLECFRNSAKTIRGNNMGIGKIFFCDPSVKSPEIASRGAWAIA